MLQIWILAGYAISVLICGVKNATLQYLDKEYRSSNTLTKKTRNTGGGGGAEAIPWQGILEEYAGEENRVKDRETPGDQVQLDDD